LRPPCSFCLVKKNKRRARCKKKNRFCACPFSFCSRSGALALYCCCAGAAAAYAFGKEVLSSYRKRLVRRPRCYLSHFSQGSVPGGYIQSGGPQPPLCLVVSRRRLLRGGKSKSLLLTVLWVLSHTRKYRHRPARRRKKRGAHYASHIDTLFKYDTMKPYGVIRPFSILPNGSIGSGDDYVFSTCW